jgi:hypothetical protein
VEYNGHHESNDNVNENYIENVKTSPLLLKELYSEHWSIQILVCAMSVITANFSL